MHSTALLGRGADCPPHKSLCDGDLLAYRCVPGWQGCQAQPAPDVADAEGGSHVEAVTDPTTAAVSTTRVPTPSHASRSA